MTHRAAPQFPPTVRPPSAPAFRLACGIAVTALALGACSGSSGTSGGSLQGNAVAASAALAQGEANDGALTQERAAGAVPGADTTKSGSAPAADPATQPKIVKSAALALTVEQIGPSAAKIRGAVAGFGGHVTQEAVNATESAPVTPLPGTTRTDTTFAVPRLGNYGLLTFAVPAEKLDAAMDAVAALGTAVVQRTSSSTDVTATYVDTEARIATKKVSIERVRALMTQTQNISQIVELEAQLASREADLESLQGQLNALKDRVAMSTLTVVISTTAAGAVTPTPDTGFVAGLKSAWNAFLTSISALLTALGAVLPWAVVLALVAVPLWRRRRPTAASGMPPSAPTLSGPAAPTAPAAGSPVAAEKVETGQG